ncbi:MAG: hypothetical protein NUV54_03315 [Candidatus Taylorbacteria bacterium]|nr:hypothetical protein [Candidatus Taylorbacteria bacterium]
MSEKEKSECEEGCNSHAKKCGSHCGHGLACHSGFYFLRWFFGFVILALVFCTGIAIGKFVGEVGGGYGYGFNHGGYSQMMRFGNTDYIYGPGMMRSYIIQTTSDSDAVAPATTVK